jgi:hypothetical protein
MDTITIRPMAMIWSFGNDWLFWVALEGTTGFGVSFSGANPPVFFFFFFDKIPSCLKIFINIALTQTPLQPLIF